MGVIFRQSFKQSIVSYLAVTIGMVNMLYVYPLIFTKPEFGFVQFLLLTASMLLPFVLLGAVPLAVKFFPQFKDSPSGHHGFLGILLALVVIGFGLFAASCFLFKDFLMRYYADKMGDFLPYLPYLLPLLLMMCLWSILSVYSSNFQRIVVPSIFNNLFIKIAVPALALIYYFQFIQFSQVATGLIIIHAAVVVFLMLYFHFLGQFHLRIDFGFLNKKLKKQMAVFAGFSLLSGAGTKLATQIDTFMVASFIDVGQVAVYAIAVAISGAIEIPKRSISGIVAPIISAAWKENNLAEIKKLYHKTALSQFIISLLLLTGVWVCIDNLFALIPHSADYIEGKYIVLILGMAKVIDMGTGSVGNIIKYSRFYKFDFYFLLALALFNVITNYLLIPPFQIFGVAYATLASLSLWNFVKCWFVWKKFGMHPFTWQFIASLLIAFLAYLPAAYLPTTGNVFFDIVFKALTVTLIYGGLTLAFRVSPDLNLLAARLLERGKQLF